jgi:DoxX-like family
MSPKTINTTYWICTVIFAILIIFSSAGGIKPSDQDIKIIHDGMGYPIYFIQFISIVKLLGIAVILIPGFRTIKEWAYAGLFFDLAGATYSGVAAAGKFDPLILTMLIWIVPGILSYYFWHKKAGMTVAR